MDQQTEKKTDRFHIEKLEERIAPTIVAVNGGGNTPNGVTGADDGRAGGRARRVAIGCLLNRAAPIAALCVI